ncbi:MAG: DNA-binding protein WhiA [Oscillospiraceae bacterium]|nr:DNA-binding protein WhiA [Oscillospiraceae bacterium]
MSFSYDSKVELCKIEDEGKCCAISECYGVLLYCNTFSSREIRIITGNQMLALRLEKQFYKAFSINFDILPDSDKTGKRTFIVSDQAKLKRIYETYGYSPENLLAHHVNLSVLEEECCKKSFLRGVFFAGGAITDPTKSYHLELATSHSSVSRGVYSLLLEMGFYPKETARSGNHILYFKQSSVIEDFLTLIGAPIHAMKLMSTKIEKDMRNAVQRKVNCDTANVTKIVDAAAAQIDAIMKIENSGNYDQLNDKLKETAQLRLENPELSIKELAELFNPPLSKSAVNHRLRKLVSLSGQ